VFKLGSNVRDQYVRPLERLTDRTRPTLIPTCCLRRLETKHLSPRERYAGVQRFKLLPRNLWLALIMWYKDIASPRCRHVAKGATGPLEASRVTPGLRAPPNRHRNGSPFSSPSGLVSGEARASPEQTTSFTASPGAPVRTAGLGRGREKPKAIIVGFLVRFEALGFLSSRIVRIGVLLSSVGPISAWCLESKHDRLD